MGNDHTTYDPGNKDSGTTNGRVDISPARASQAAPGIDPLTERSLRVWSAGDYDRIANGFRHEAAAFVDRLELERGTEVLDAACGSGNLTIPAARTGALVTGFDLVPSLLEATAAWSERVGLEIALDQGTVEDLPYADASFDVVMSMFGVMFAARPERVVFELACVTRPGGRVALANWTRAGFIGQLLATHVGFVTPPAGVPSPLAWGDETVIHERFDARDWDVTTTRRVLTFRYAFTPAGTAELFRTSYGPTIRTLETKDPTCPAELAADLVYLWEKHQHSGAHATQVDSEYLEVIAVRRGSD